MKDFLAALFCVDPLFLKRNYKKCSGCPDLCYCSTDRQAMTSITKHCSILRARKVYIFCKYNIKPVITWLLLAFFIGLVFYSCVAIGVDRQRSRELQAEALLGKFPNCAERDFLEENCFWINGELDLIETAGFEVTDFKTYSDYLLRFH